MSVLITGASGGIGFELARQFAKDGADIIMVARDQRDLDEAAAKIAAEFGKVKTVTIALDLSLPHAADEVYGKVKKTGWTVDYLVNNAGFGDFGPFATTDRTKELSMLALNMVTLTELCKLFIPDMIARKKSRILNIASTAAFLPGPYMSVYYATKAYVLSFSQAIGEELRGTGVTVTTLCPGPTRTHFAESANATGLKMFKRNLPSAEDVASYGYRSMMVGKSVVIHGLQNKLLIFVSRFLSMRVLARISGKLAKS